MSHSPLLSGTFVGLEPDHPLNRGLVADYTVVDRPGWSRGNTLRDLCQTIRKGDNGTLTNGPTWQGARGRPGGWGSLGFDGVDDYVDCGPILHQATATPNFTVSCWVRLNSIASIQVLVFKDHIGLGGTAREWQLYFTTTSGGRFGFWPCDGASVLADSLGVPSVGVWYYVCGYFDRNNSTIGISVNGGPPNTASNSTAIPAGTPATVELGRQFFGPMFFLNGSIDAVRICNRDKSLAEIQAERDEDLTGCRQRFRWLRSWGWGVEIVSTGTTKLPLINGGLSRTGMTNGGGLI